MSISAANPEATAPVVAEAARRQRAQRLTESLLPYSSRCNSAQRIVLIAGFIALLAAMLGTAAHIAFGLGGTAWGNAIPDGVIAIFISIAALLVSVRARVEREHTILWTLGAAGLSSYAAAMVLWGFWLAHVKNPPDPSVCDVLWWASYALAGGVIIGAASHHAQRWVSLTIWLDGMIAAGSTAALAAVFLLEPVVSSAHGAHQAVFANLLYPLGDLVLGALLVGVVSLEGWRFDRRLLAFLAAVVLLLVGDSVNSIQVAHGALIANSADQLVYMAAFTCIVIGAWQPDGARQPEDTGRWSRLIVPGLFALAAPALLVYGQFSHLSLAAFLLTLVAMLAAMVRLALALRDMLTINDLRRAAITDDLTELPNRRRFFSALRQAIGTVQRDGGRLTAMMFDLDNFKQINDTLGHDAGDDLLRLVGPRLIRCMRPGDLIARLGGDEFAILLAPGSSPRDAAGVAESVLQNLRDPFRVHGVGLRLTASVGIASYPDDAQTAEALIKCIDVAMYEAKRSRRGWEHYEPERDLNTTEKLELADALAGAIEQREIEAHFQPVVDTVTREILAVEALARWRRADGTLRPPADFLQAAEMAGLSRPLTRLMLDLALSQMAAWRELQPELRMAVNATVADLLDESFPDDVAAALDRYSLPPEAIGIEVTESSIVADPVRAGAVLERLHGLGVSVGLDDFGTGYSSLTHLRELPVDVVKIDRSFVGRMCEESADAAIVYATIELAHRLNLRVVAEGVEDERTWAAVRELGADKVQGYAFSRPLPPAELGELLERSTRAHLADSQSLPTPASTASGGSIS